MSQLCFIQLILQTYCQQIINFLHLAVIRGWAGETNIKQKANLSALTLFYKILLIQSTVAFYHLYHLASVIHCTLYMFYYPINYGIKTLNNNIVVDQSMIYIPWTQVTIKSLSKPLPHLHQSRYKHPRLWHQLHLQFLSWNQFLHHQPQASNLSRCLLTIPWSQLLPWCHPWPHWPLLACHPSLLTLASFHLNTRRSSTPWILWGKQMTQWDNV